MTTGALDASDSVGSDEELTEEQLDRLMKQMEANRLEFGDDPGYVNELQLRDDALLERLGLTDDTLAFEARWGEEE